VQEKERRSDMMVVGIGKDENYQKKTDKREKEKSSRL
jgi:hypothetical protein